MGIVNVTPDSFSGDGVEDPDAAIARAARFSGTPEPTCWTSAANRRGRGTRPIEDDVEIARVVPVIDALRERFPDAPISVDTYKPAVARAAHAAGADIVNSVWGAPDALLDVAAELGMPIVDDAQPDGHAITRATSSTPCCAISTNARAEPSRAGSRREAIVLDPGIGFGKTADQNLARPARVGPARRAGLSDDARGVAQDRRSES